MSELAAAVVVLLLVALASWAVPAVGMRMLAPSLATSGRLVTNYRGKRVFLGLGTVWVFWSLSLICVLSVLGRVFPAMSPGVLALLMPAAVLALGCFLFGLVDDVFGTSADKGLRGHLRALAKGRLTTGGLKVIGIGAVSLWAATQARAFSVLPLASGTTARVAQILLATIVIAGCANILNLLDLRPGRALKSYLVLGFGAWLVVLIVWAAGRGPWTLPDAVQPVTLAVALAGPALAVWRFDLTEKGMLGDAGANPAGAVVGLLLAATLPLWALAVAAVLVVAANLVSERVSFSAVIDGNALLSWVDSLGRPRESRSRASSDTGEQTGAK